VIPLFSGSQIYIDPDSPSEWELGTLDHPFKTLYPAFVELNNYFFDRRNATVFLKRGPIHYLNILTQQLYISNLNIQILGYSNGTYDDERPTIVQHEGGNTQQLTYILEIAP